MHGGNMNNILLYLSNKHKGDNYLIYKGLKDKEKLRKSEIDEITNIYLKNDIKFISIFDLNYPSSLFMVHYPPFVLYYKGNINLLNDLTKKRLYLVDEMNSEYSKEILSKNIKTLTENSILVTNSYASEKHLIDEFKNANASIIYIAKEGLNSSKFDDINLENNLIISQYPIDDHPRKINFRQSNVLSAAIANSLVIFSSYKDSKVNNLVSEFLNLGKDINCFPGSLDEKDGNNHLIQSGANLITQIQAVAK
ncbi:DNA-processing protein DprA [Mycoplasmopsis synoviae]|nr:DNA-processing protein DprA [Mycoplasmopsis synoviae]UBM43530.1 DNA-protecting protein DprA [Mycoplasmopsis synoviae]